MGSSWVLAGTLIFLACPTVVLESTEARGYAFMLFFSTGACALLNRYLAVGGRWRLPLYALCCVLGIWSHLVTVVVPIGHAAVLACRLGSGPVHGRRAALALSAIALSAVTTVTLLAPVIPELWGGSEAFRRTGVDQPDLFGREGRWIVLGLGGSWAVLGGLCGLLVLAVGMISMLRNPRLGRAGLVCGAPILVALLLVLLLGTWVYARFLVLGIPFTVIAITAGLRGSAGANRGFGVLLAGMLLFGWGLDLSRRSIIPRQPVREVMAMIPADDSGIGTYGVVDLPIVAGWHLRDPGRIVDLGFQPEVLGDGIKLPGIEWLVVAYPGRSIPGFAGGPPPEPGDTGLIDGFVVIEFLEGWIDDDGSMILLRRQSKGNVDQS